MKTKHKIILVFVFTSVLFFSLVVPCFALNSYSSNSVRYRLNCPHRLRLGVENREGLPTKYTLVDMPQTVFTGDDLETMYQFGGIGYFSNYVGGAVLTSSYNPYDERHPFADSYSQIVINQSPISDGAYDNDESWYALGYGYDLNTLRRVFSPQDFNQMKYLWQADQICFEWDVYYFDPLTSETARKKNGISLSVSFVVHKGFEYTSTTADSVARMHKAIYEITILDDDNTPKLTTAEEIPTVLGINVEELPNSQYDLLVVNLSYHFVQTIDNELRDYYRNDLPYTTVTSFGKTLLRINTPPANVYGVGNMGISPMYSVGVSTFTGEIPYSNYARSIARNDSSDVDTVGLFGWLGGAVGGFLDTPLFGFFSLGDLLAVCLAIGVTVLVLKLFAGG